MSKRHAVSLRSLEWHDEPPVVTYAARKQPPPEKVRLFLHETEQVTGEQEELSALFYEYYRGYTIYSNAQGYACIHGAGQRGCLRLQGRFVSFPDAEEAKNMIRSFRVNGWTAQQHMNRRVSSQAYVCLNAPVEPISEAG